MRFWIWPISTVFWSNRSGKPLPVWPDRSVYLTLLVIHVPGRDGHRVAAVEVCSLLGGAHCRPGRGDRRWPSPVRAAVLHAGLKKPFGTGPVTAVTGLTGPARPGSGSGRLETGSNLNFKFEFQKMEKFQKILKNTSSCDESNGVKFFQIFIYLVYFAGIWS